MKRIIIVGASTGIGREMAVLFAKQGCLVAISGRRTELLNEIRESYPSAIFTFGFDVTRDDNRWYLQQMITALGGLDLFIYNTGTGHPSEVLDEEMEIITTKTNVNGFVELTSAAFNYFARQGFGQIALTSSVAALRGNSWAPAYSASKSFMSNYAEGLNIKAKKLGKAITITDTKPGFVKTKLAKGPGQFWVSSPEKAAKQIISAIESRKRIAYITRRWWIIGQIMKILPFSIFRRIA